MPATAETVSPNVQTSTRASAEPQRRVRMVRVSTAAVPLIVLNCGWIANSEIRNTLTEGTVSTLFLGVALILFVVTLINLAVRRIFGERAAFNQAELMLLYTMLSMSSAIAGVSYVGFLTLYLPSPFWLAKTDPSLGGFAHLLPSFVGPRNPSILYGFYKGRQSIFEPHILAAWAFPIVVWGLFLLVLIWTQLCLSSVMRRRWADEEHLPFPVIALPLEMTREGAPIYRNKLFVAGFTIPLFLHSLNTIAGLVPGVPSFPINSAHDLSGLFSSPPWNGVDAVLAMIHPVGVGFGYLVNTDVLFSLWFFYLLKKAVDVFGVAIGWRTPMPGDWGADNSDQFPYTTYQSWGAWAALVIAMLWSSRRYLRAYYDRAVNGDPGGLDRDEALSARWALGGFAAGFTALCVFVWAQGGSAWLPIVFFGGYFVLMLGISRVRAELAVLATGTPMMLPQIITSVAGSANLSSLDIAHLSMLSWFNMDYRSPAMPQELEGLQGLRRARAKLSPSVWGILLASTVAIVSALLWDLQMYYVNGADSAKVVGWRNIETTQSLQAAARMLTTPTPSHASGIAAMVVGFAIVLILAALRARFVGFALAPAGYAINAAGMNDLFWCDMFVAWVIKSLFLRYGGRNLYQSALPLFYGLILGDFATGAAWSIYGMFTHTMLFRTFPC